MINAGLKRIADEEQQKADSAADKLAGFLELRAQAMSIYNSVPDGGLLENASASDLKALTRYILQAKGEKQSSHLSNKSTCVSFLNTVDDIDDLLLLHQPPGFVTPGRVADLALEWKSKMSESMVLTKVNAQNARTATTGQSPAPVLQLSHAVTEEKRASVATAASLSFDASVVDGSTLLCLKPPTAAVLEFGNARGDVLKGRQIIYNFGPRVGWYRGLILARATDASVNANRKVCNFRVYFEADEEFISQPLHPETYNPNPQSPEHAWVLVAAPTATQETAPAPEMLQLTYG